MLNAERVDLQMIWFCKVLLPLNKVHLSALLLLVKHTHTHFFYQ